MTAAVIIERPAGDPYRVEVVQRSGDKEQHLVTLDGGQKSTYLHVWPGAEIVIREIQK